MSAPFDADDRRRQNGQTGQQRKDQVVESHVPELPSDGRLQARPLLVGKGLAAVVAAEDALWDFGFPRGCHHTVSFTADFSGTVKPPDGTCTISMAVAGWRAFWAAMS